ncbi:transcriptional regulator [Alphaproteobacteria bacterium LSUCC0684]
MGWSAQDLANRSGVGATTLRRYEMSDGIPSANAKSLQTVIETFQRAGIEFTGDPLKNPGVILHLKE